MWFYSWILLINRLKIINNSNPVKIAYIQFAPREFMVEIIYVFFCLPYLLSKYVVETALMKFQNKAMFVARRTNEKLKNSCHLVAMTGHSPCPVWIYWCVILINVRRGYVNLYNPYIILIYFLWGRANCIFTRKKNPQVQIGRRDGVIYMKYGWYF